MMTIVDKIKADINRHEMMGCYELDKQLATINIQAFSPISPTDIPSYQVDNHTATIKVRGLLIPKADYDYGTIITGYNVIADYLHKADSDPSIKQIVLDVDSNGGYIKGLDTLINQIQALSKPISTQVVGNMQSAAYWLGASTQHITAERSSYVGSIGVFVVHNEQSVALQNNGETFSIFRSGLWKGAFSRFMPLAKHEQERLQQGVDETANAFFEHVAQHRKINKDDIQAWQGDSFNANKALELGLIDEISHSTAYPTLTTTMQTKEYAMDLQQALAKVDNLHEQIVAKDNVIADKDAQIATLQTALNEQKQSHRLAQIDELASMTGKSFDDDEKQAFLAMDDTAFKLISRIAKPSLPQGLETAQAVSGKTNNNTISAKISTWGDE